MFRHVFTSPLYLACLQNARQLNRVASVDAMCPVTSHIVADSKKSGSTCCHYFHCFPEHGGGLLLRNLSDRHTMYPRMQYKADSSDGGITNCTVDCRLIWTECLFVQQKIKHEHILLSVFVCLVGWLFVCLFVCLFARRMTARINYKVICNFISLYCFLSVQYLNYISVFQLIALN